MKNVEPFFTYFYCEVIPLEFNVLIPITITPLKYIAQYKFSNNFPKTIATTFKQYHFFYKYQRVFEKIQGLSNLFQHLKYSYQINMQNPKCILNSAMLMFLQDTVSHINVAN